MRKEMIIDYHEKKNLTEEKQIKEAVVIAHNFLRHLYTYEAARRQLIEEPFYEDEEEERRYLSKKYTGDKKQEGKGLFSKTKMIKLDSGQNLHDFNTEKASSLLKEDKEKYESF